MATISLQIEVPADVVYDRNELTARLNAYALRILTPDKNRRPRKLDGIRKLRGFLKSDLSIEQLKAEALEERFGL